MRLKAQTAKAHYEKKLAEEEKQVADLREAADILEQEFTVRCHASCLLGHLLMWAAHGCRAGLPRRRSSANASRTRGMPKR